MAVLWLDTIGSDDLDSVGGKGASLGELTGAGLPVPPGFVVTAGTYRSFIEQTGIEEELFEAVDIDPDDSSALADAEQTAEELILDTELPEEIASGIVEAYDDLDNGDSEGQRPSSNRAAPGDSEAFVAVRSSATAEDLPDASFAGQQETFLNITREALLDRVKQCWASLFTKRAIYYREEQGFDHDIVDIAVVVQEMVDAEKSGVMFTSHPSTGDDQIIVEAAWGLGEAVVSGSVSPDNYVVDPSTAETTTVTIADKKAMHVKDPETGETVEREVPDEKRTERVLTDEEIARLTELGRRVEDHYGTPQDVEWAIVDNDVFMLQSRPITTITEDTTAQAEATDGGGLQQEQRSDVLLKGLGASPGVASGPAQIVTKLDQLDKIGEGDIIITEMTTPDMVPAMKRAAGIITDEGGMTSHAAIVSRELGVPAVVGSGGATTQISDGQVITIDGDKGTVEEGATEESDEREPHEDVKPQSPVKPMTATEVKVNVSIPDAAHRAAVTGADGVGLLRLEHMILSTDKTPERYISDHSADAYIEEIVSGVRGVADEFYPRPVRVRTLDAPTDEFRQLKGGTDEPDEHNPMLEIGRAHV